MMLAPTVCTEDIIRLKEASDIVMDGCLVWTALRMTENVVPASDSWVTPGRC